MEEHRFDNLARTLASTKTRRGFLGALAALGAGLAGARGAEAQVTQASCGNVICRANPGACAPGCVCCVYPNGNSRCRPASQCTGSGSIIPPAGTTTAAPATTTTTAAPTSLTTTVAPPTSTTTTTAAPPTSTTTTTSGPVATTTTTTAAPEPCTNDLDCVHLDQDCVFGRCNTGAGACFEAPNPAACAPVDCMRNLNACPGRDGICRREPDPSQNGNECGSEGSCCNGDCCSFFERCTAGVCREG